MKMDRTNFSGIFPLIALCCLLASCGAANKESSGNNKIEAAINEDGNCSNTLNLKSNKVYAYRGDAFFMTPSIQAGGHSDNFVQDLGVNIFAINDATLTAGVYDISDGGGSPGTAYVFYIPDDEGPDEFISAADQGSLQVSRILLEDDGDGNLQVSDFEATFTNVLMISNLTGDTICIASFDLSVTGAN
jgi:hypothetical protein